MPVVVCECIAQERNLPTFGPRSLLGGILPARNDEWLNAGPRALIAFTGDNADMKFPFRLPIMDQTRDCLLFDIQRRPYCGARSLGDQTRDMQANMAAIAGYWGGYTAKMQHIGQRELQQLREALQRKVEGEKSEGEAKDFHNYSRRLVKDLEMKGVIRTAVEGINLSLHAKHPDVLMGECIRTFPSVNFPAMALLLREEVETLKRSGASVIAAFHHGRSHKGRMYQDAPFDLMYGFRGGDEAVDLLTPYEMLLHYKMEPIFAPTNAQAAVHATWTAEGKAYRQECADAKTQPEPEAGVHYVAAPSEGRILLPDIGCLHNLRHRWCWEARPRPHLPTWSFAKVPRPQLSPEENARLLCLYLRPWTLNPTESTRSNPLLSMLGKCLCGESGLTPVWTQLPTQGVTRSEGDAAGAHVDPGAAQNAQEAGAAAESAAVSQGAAGGGEPALKKRRLLRKTSQGATQYAQEAPAAAESAAASQGAAGGRGPAPQKRRVLRQTSQADAPEKHRLSYAASWDAYIGGNVVSKTSRRYILNLLAATAATKTEDTDDSSEDSQAEAWCNFDMRAGSMDLVRQTLEGMAARSSDEGLKAMGAHARTIRLGRALWQSPPLAEEHARNMRERFFDDGTFPPLGEVRKAVAKAKEPDEQRPAPFAGRTQPYADLSITRYGQRLYEWLDALQHEAEVPTTEQLELIIQVKDRLLLEFVMEKEGVLRKDIGREAKEQPLLGFCHGSPGTGKTRVIAWIRRMFVEALGWQHEQEFLFVAFQNRVAHTMGGSTMHSGGDIAIGGNRVLEHTDIDILFTRNQCLRWVIIDELPMVPDELLGTFEHHLADAAVESRFKYRDDKSMRLFGGYNMIGFGDFYQIPPIPASASLAIPPIEKKSEAALRALDLLWKSGHDSLNLFVELTIQKRIDDPWYASVMEECRRGALSQEAYNFLVGLPTEHAGSWAADGTLQCNSKSCADLPDTWKRMSATGGTWADMQCMECSICSAERRRRNRVINGEDPRVRQEPYLSAPFIHKNNEPKYHAMLLRASEQAKTDRQHTIWFAATDTPENPASIVTNPAKLKQRLERFLQFHDQQTAGIPGLNILYEGMRARVTEKLVKHKGLTILKHSPCTVIGWDLHPASRLRQDGAERLLEYMPLCIYIKFPDTTWVVDKRLGPGVWPLFPVERTWVLSAAQGTKIKRKGFTLLPDYASTAFMIQGATLQAAIADCGDITDVGGLSERMTVYVILSRVKSAMGLLLIRAFCPELFQMGVLPGPYCLLKMLRRRFGQRAEQQSMGANAPASSSGAAHDGASLPASSSGAAHDGASPILYGPDEAVEEFKQLMTSYEAWRAQEWCFWVRADVDATAAQWLLHQDMKS